MNETSTSTAAAATLHESTTVSEAVVNAVADEEGVSPIDVSPPLYAVVDPDALDELVSSMNRWSDEPRGGVVFSYAGYEVTVSGSGEVSLEEETSSGREDSRRKEDVLGSEDTKDGLSI